MTVTSGLGYLILSVISRDFFAILFLPFSLVLEDISLRSSSKLLRYASYFNLSSGCLKMCSNRVFRVGCNISNTRDCVSTNTRDSVSSNTRDSVSSNTRDSVSSNTRNSDSSNTRDSVSSNTRDSVSSGYPNIEKRVEKYDAQQSIFDEIRGVCIADEILSRVFNISTQTKQKLKSKGRSKLVKIYAI